MPKPELVRSAAATLVLSIAVGACSSSKSPSGPPAPPDPAEVATSVGKTLNELAALGNKRVGTDEGKRAGDYIADRFRAAGLADVRFESFAFPSFRKTSSSLAVTLDGAATPMQHEVFYYTGVGHVDADIVDLGTGHETDYAGKDVTGKIVMVRRDTFFHRQAQAALVAKHGGVAMLYLSVSPKNLIQIGTVNDPEDGLGPVPTVTVGADDGQKIADALMGGKPAHAVIDVQASIAPSSGRNVIGRLRGSDPSGAYFLVGAHYDTWYAGSLDNGTGVAATIRIAEDFVKRGGRKLGVVFVAYDGEELGLFGGYDFLRKHVLVGAEPILGFINFEIPSNANDGAKLTGVTNGSPIRDALYDTDTHLLYGVNGGMEAVPAAFGGIIPTDIQGMYWSGVQGITTACNSPYYHTTEDTPDKLDLSFLADATLHFEAVLDELDAKTAASFAVRDPKLWKPDVTSSTQGNDLVVKVVAKDASGAPQAGANVRVWLDVDDFTRAYKQDVVADAQGNAQVVVPAAALAMGAAARWVHVTTGQGWPLSETILPVK